MDILSWSTLTNFESGDLVFGDPRPCPPLLYNIDCIILWVFSKLIFICSEAAAACPLTLVEPRKGINYEPIADTNVGHYLGGLGVVNDQLFIFG